MKGQGHSQWEVILIITLKNTGGGVYYTTVSRPRGARLGALAEIGIGCYIRIRSDGEGEGEGEGENSYNYRAYS